jgi:hypothetical protein
MTQQEQPKVTITLTIDALNVVAAGLGKLPMETSLEVFNEIQKQAKDQLNSEPAQTQVVQ